MSFQRSVQASLNRVAQLFSRSSSVVWIHFSAAVLLQIAFWYVATPGPRLLGAQPRGIEPALVAVLYSMIVLLVIPSLLLRTFGISLSDAGLRWGRWRLGLTIAAIGAALAVPLMYVGALDPAVQRTYPWPGSWLADGGWRWPAWVGIYAVYYLSFEFFYRGFLLRVLSPRWGAPAALWTQAAFATLVHVGKPLAETIAAFPASLLFGVIALRTRSVLYPALLHLAIGLATDAFVLYHVGRP